MLVDIRMIISKNWNIEVEFPLMSFFTVLEMLTKPSILLVTKVGIFPIQFSNLSFDLS